MKALLAFVLLCALGACAASLPRPGAESEVRALANQIRALDPAVDAAEADRAALVAYVATFQLAQAYGITDPPLIHNAKVNAGRKPRGLCYHWAEDMEARLRAEGFQSLEIKRAIANADRPLLIEHSTAVIAAKGAPLSAGIVLDPWRKGGTLFWRDVEADKRYTWYPREEVLRAKGQIIYKQRSANSLAPQPSN